MKKSGRIFFTVCLVFVIFLGWGFGVKNKAFKEKKKNELVNISSLSEEFMNDYFESSEEISQSGNEDNVLLITSKQKIEDGYGATNIVEAPNNLWLLQYESEEEKNEALEKFKTDESIVSAEENTKIRLLETNSLSSGYNSWGIEKMGLNYASNVVNEMELNEVTVAIIDSGCNMDLFNRNYPGKIVETYVPSGEAMDDSLGHGTHIAGTIAEGTPSNVKILPVKLSTSYDSSYGGTVFSSMVELLQSINYIVYYQKADVINMSLGTYGESEALYEALVAAEEANVICVAAAGNDNIPSPFFPAYYDNTMAIAAVDSSLNKASFSNYGSKISFATPGVSILSINGTKNGTSVATPHATSAVAILKSFNKDLSLEDVMELLKRYAIDLGDNGWDQYFGYGFISFYGAEFCDGVDCDEYNVFKNDDNTLSVVDIKLSNATYIYPEYNYGSITNLLSPLVKVYYNGTDYYTKYLWQLDNIKVRNYDPYSYTKQDVTIQYAGGEFILHVDNSKATTSGWEYEAIDEDSIKLVGLKAASDDDIKKLYVPQMIDGYKVEQIGLSEVFGCAETREIYLPEGIDKLPNYALGTCGGSSAYLKKIVLPRSLTTIASVAFTRRGSGWFTTGVDATYYVYSGSYSKTYVSDKGFTYVTMDPYDMKVILPKTEYKAFEMVDTTGLAINLIYDDGDQERVETIRSGYSIEYPNGSDSFRFGDTYFTILAYNEFGEYVEEQVEVTVTKATPEYTVPTYLEAEVGQTLAEIELPSGFEWVSGTQVVLKNGRYKAKYVPEDTTNYETVENIEITVLVDSDKIEIVPEISIDDKTYDGTTDVDLSSIKISNLASDDYTIESVSLSSAMVGQTVAKVKIRLTDTKFESYTLTGGNQEYEYTVDVKVEKAELDVEDNSKDVTVMYDGEYHTIEFSLECENAVLIKYMDENGNYILDEIPEYSGVGTYAIKYKVYIDDNYTEYFGERTLTITGDIMVNNSVDYEGIYDGEEHSININVNITDYNIKYSVDNTDYDLDELPVFKSVGEYTINYKITSIGYEDLFGSNKVKIYGIKEFESTLVVKNNILVVKNNSFSSISNKVITYAVSTSYSHYNKDNVLITSDLTKTGDIIRINLNGSKNYEYSISILGDVNGDGKVSSADYVKIKKHIMETELITDNIYLYAADINNDNKMSSADYVKIRKYIMNGESL